MDLEPGWDYSSGSRVAGPFPISKDGRTGVIDRSLLCGISGKAGTLGRILASHLFRETLDAKDQATRVRSRPSSQRTPGLLLWRRRGNRTGAMEGVLFEEQAWEGINETPGNSPE